MNDYASTGEPTWTPRKREVLERLAKGRTNAEIAGELGLSLAGVKWHVSEVLSILGVESREEAAEYWHRERSLSRRLRGAAKAIAGPVLSWKAVAGTTGFAAFAGAGIVIASLSADGGSSQPTSDTTTATPVPTATATARIDGQSLQYVDILTTDLGNGESVTLAASLGDYLCFRETMPSPLGFLYGCYGPKDSWKPGLHMGFGTSRPALTHGTAAPGADHVEIDLHDGTTLRIALVPAPAALGLDTRFWAAVAPRAELIGRIRSVDADGDTLEETTLYDPPGTPPRAQVTAPLRDLIQVGSNRDDRNAGSIAFGNARAGAIAAPEGGLYRFSVEHDGTRPLTLHFWCATGVLPLAWEEGPDTSGNGIVTASIPPNSAGCFFLVGGGDGTYRISTVSGP